MTRVFVVLAVCAAIIATPTTAYAQEYDSGVDDDGLDVGIGADGDDGSPTLADFCASPIWADTPTCAEYLRTLAPSLPECEIDPVDGTFTNEPCRPPTAPCIDFGESGEPCAAVDALPPPDPAVLAEQALGETPWPDITLGTGPGDTGTVFAMYPYSLTLVAPGWSWDAPISASASLRGLTVTVFAKPVEVVWDTGPINSHPSPNRAYLRHVTCQTNGRLAGAGGGSGWDGQDLSPGGPDCLTMWYGTENLIGGPTSISAELTWEVWWEASDGQTSGPGWRTWTTNYSRDGLHVWEFDAFFVGGDYRDGDE